jgi:hypothetical protein
MIRLPRKGEHIYVRADKRRGGLVNRQVVLSVNKDSIHLQGLNDDGSPIVDPVPMPRDRHPASSFIGAITFREWDVIKKYWQARPWRPKHDPKA